MRALIKLIETVKSFPHGNLIMEAFEDKVGRKIVTQADWVWMPHPGHFICAKDCKFFLNTYVNGYIVSTVGELWLDSAIRKMHAKVRGIEIKGRGDEWDFNYAKQIGYEDIGHNRKYETMVFKAKRNDRSGEKCCPYTIDVADGELDFLPYNTADAARKGHLALCEKYSNVEAPV